MGWQWQAEMEKYFFEKCAAYVVSSTLRNTEAQKGKGIGNGNWEWEPEIAGHIWESATCAFQSGIMCSGRDAC